MTGKTHALGGLTAAVTISSFGLHSPDSVWDAGLWGLYLGAAVTGALLPDIDHRKSSISQKHKISAFFIHLFLGHRGFTHSPFCCVLLMLLGFCLWYFFPYSIVSAVLWGFFIGYCSHILLDALNPKGIPVFYPFVKKKFAIAKIKTGGALETVIFVMMSGIFVLFAYRLVFEQGVLAPVLQLAKSIL